VFGELGVWDFKDPNLLLGSRIKDIGMALGVLKLNKIKKTNRGYSSLKINI